MKLVNVCVLFLCLIQPAYAVNDVKDRYKGISVGISEQKLFKVYPFKTARTYRQEGKDQWVTFNEPARGVTLNLITFHLSQGVVESWAKDDRDEVITEYLGEFCSLQGFPKIYTAIKDVLKKIPYKDFLNVTSRRRPVIFVEVYDSGTARFASSQEMIISQQEPPCCQEGFTLMKLGLGLDGGKSSTEIEGVVAHELAHRVLDHIINGNVDCNAEREANALIKKWGFGEEFKAASAAFGQRKGDPVSCQEKNP